MKRSLPAFIMGLITSIFCLFWGFITVLAGNFITSLIGALESAGSGVEAGASSTGVAIIVLGWLCFLGGILGIIGASQCFKKAKVGGILLAISTVMCGSLLIYLFINTIKNTGTQMLVTSIMIYLVPVGLFIASTICAFLAKPYQQKPMVGYYNANVPNGYYNQNSNGNIEQGQNQNVNIQTQPQNFDLNQNNNQN